MDTEERCPYSIRWTFGTDARCEKKPHIHDVVITEYATGQFSVAFSGTDGHVSHAKLPDVPGEGSVLNWVAGDRREFTGDWPGLCPGDRNGCTLPLGHHGRHAP